MDRPAGESFKATLDLAVWTVVRALTALPLPVMRAFTSRYNKRIDGLEPEPEVHLALLLMDRFGGESFENLPLPEAREEMRRTARIFAGPQIPLERVEDLSVPGPAGDLPVRLYRPAGARTPAPLVVYLHGGGWVTGGLDTHDGCCRYLADRAGVLVLAVDYRLAPEHPFPAAVEDAVAAFRWAVAKAADIGADPERVAVAGDSAGGNLAAVVSQVTTAEGGPRPALQVLVYPVTDLSAKHPSYRLFTDGFFLTEAQMDWYRGHYIGDEDGTDPRISPLLAEDLTGLPPAYIATAGFDVLRDEGEAYARRLQAAGVPTTLRRHPGLVHGFTGAASLGRTPGRAVDEIASALRWAL